MLNSKKTPRMPGAGILAGIAIGLWLFPCQSVFAKGGNDMAFKIETGSFKEGAIIPRDHTCEGADGSPSINWTEPPEGTKSFVLTVEDPDAPYGTFTHWVIYDIPANLKGLSGQIPTTTTLEGGIKQGQNDFGKTGYGGPCPPRGHGRHRYYFILKALDVPTLAIPAGSSKGKVEKALKGHVLGEARFMGVYER